MPHPVSGTPLVFNSGLGWSVSSTPKAGGSAPVQGPAEDWRRMLAQLPWQVSQMPLPAAR